MGTNVCLHKFGLPHLYMPKTEHFVPMLFACLVTILQMSKI